MDTVIPYAMVSRGHSNGSRKNKAFVLDLHQLDEFLLAFWASICLETEVRQSTNTTLIMFDMFVTTSVLFEVVVGTESVCMAFNGIKTLFTG